MKISSEKPLNILVVDDEPYITDLIQRVFELEGMEIRSAANVNEALKRIEEQLPSLIITDIMLPEISGEEFIKILKSNPETKRIKIIALTVLDAFENLRQSVILGADDYICKPFDPQKVLWSVQRLLGRFQTLKPGSGLTNASHS